MCQVIDCVLLMAVIIIAFTKTSGYAIHETSKGERVVDSPPSLNKSTPNLQEASLKRKAISIQWLAGYFNKDNLNTARQTS